MDERERSVFWLCCRPGRPSRASTVVGGCGGCFYAATVVVVVAVAPAVWTTTPEGTVTPEGMDTPEGREMVMAETMPKELATARRVAKQAFIVAGGGVGWGGVLFGEGCGRMVANGTRVVASVDGSE